MSYDSRILGMLELELSKNLSFTLCEASGEPLMRCKSLRLQDDFEFTVWVRNDTGFAVKGIRGTIAPTEFVKFAEVDFQVPLVASEDGFAVATIRGRVIALPRRGTLLDHIAKVSLSASADLSGIVMQEWDKPIGFAQPSGVASLGATDLPTGVRPSTSRCPAPAVYGTSIQLSKP